MRQLVCTKVKIICNYCTKHVTKLTAVMSFIVILLTMIHLMVPMNSNYTS